MFEGDRLCGLILGLKKDAIDVPGRMRRVENIAGSGESDFVAV
jgi:hypothetical protein